MLVLDTAVVAWEKLIVLIRTEMDEAEHVKLQLQLVIIQILPVVLAIRVK